ncbi:MAG: efflux RND transporter periplasmic adaptor subunit [Herminiimonas sp.]|nr:efflux RND transporter periplasmic adaptor subunit [Herminiimonas sp.]
MTEQRHATLQIHADAGQHAPPLHRAQIVRRFRIGVYVLLALLLIGAVITVMQRVATARALETRTVQQNQQHVVTVAATSNARSQPIMLPGTLQGSVEAPIYARSAGYVTRWTSDIGTKVRKGDLLAEISTPEIDQQLSQAIAARPQIVATVDLAKSSFARWQNLRKQDAVSQQELDERQSTLSQAQSNLASADANILRLKELKSFQRIVAPFAGTIIKRNINIGDLIDAGNGGAAKALFTLAQTGDLRVYLYVPQAYSQLIKTGEGVDITQAELPGQVFRGTVVRTAGAIDAASRTLQIEIKLPNADSKLLAGTYVNVALPTLARKSLTVPINTLLLRAEGPRIGVVDASNKVHLHTVTLGTDYGLMIEVLNGIGLKDQLVVNPPDSLADGDVVVVAPKPAPKSAAAVTAEGAPGNVPRPTATANATTAP